MRVKRISAQVLLITFFNVIFFFLFWCCGCYAPETLTFLQIHLLVLFDCFLTFALFSLSSRSIKVLSSYYSLKDNSFRSKSSPMYSTLCLSINFAFQFVVLIYMLRHLTPLKDFREHFLIFRWSFISFLCQKHKKTGSPTSFQR